MQRSQRNVYYTMIECNLRKYHSHLSAIPGKSEQPDIIILGEKIYANDRICCSSDQPGVRSTI